MAISHQTITVGTTAVRLTPALPTDTTFDPHFEGRVIVVQNGGAQAIRLGGEGVTWETAGFELAASQGVSLDLSSTDELYAIAQASTTTRVLLTGI